MGLDTISFSGFLISSRLAEVDKFLDKDREVFLKWKSDIFVPEGSILVEQFVAAETAVGDEYPCLFRKVFFRTKIMIAASKIRDTIGKTNVGNRNPIFVAK